MPSLNSLLLPYQQEWLADDSQVKVWEKSRRIGATWTEACNAVLTAGKKLGGFDYYYMSINEQLSKEFIRDATSWAEEFNVAVADIGETLLDSGSKAIRVQQIIFTSGKRIMGLPSNPAVLRGRMGYLLLDEFGFVESPDELLKAGLAFLTWGGKIRILSTHNGEDSLFNQIIKDIKSGRSPYTLHKTTIEDAVEDGLYKRICLKTKQQYSKTRETEWLETLVKFYGQDKADEELFCIPRNSGGSYFPRILVERAMDDEIPVFNLTLKDEFAMQSGEVKTSHINDWLSIHLLKHIASLNPNYKSSFGFDFGRSGDLSYLLVVQELPNLIRKSAFALEMRNVPFTEQEQILFWICDRLPRLIGGDIDSTGSGASIGEKLADRYGRYRIAQVKLSLQWYNEHFPKYKAALEDQKILLPASSDIISDHAGIQVVRGTPKPVETKTKGTDGGQRHSDSAIAAVLCWHASCRDNESAQPALGSFVFDNYQLGSA